MLGGNSLNAIKTIQKLKNIIPNINTNDIFLHPTIEQLANLYSKKYIVESKKYDNIIEIENKLKSLFDIEACLLKYKLPRKTFIVLFIDKMEIINSQTFVRFIESELDDACQPHYIIHSRATKLCNQDREITMNDTTFFQFIKKTSPLNI